jgi:hypothetical protein
MPVCPRPPQQLRSKRQTTIAVDTIGREVAGATG